MSNKSLSVGFPPEQFMHPAPAQKASAALPELSTKPPSIGNPTSSPPVM